MITEPPTLRIACREDQEFLIEVYASSRREELATVPWGDDQREAFVRMQFMAQDSYYKERFPDASYQIILLGKEQAGRLYVLRSETTIRILDISLLHRYRRRGIGAALIRELIEEAKQSAKPLQIYVETFNPSLPLFTQLGFKKIREEGINFLLEWKPD